MIFCSFSGILTPACPCSMSLSRRLEPVPISYGSKLLLLCSEYGKITRLSPNSSRQDIWI